MTEPIEPQSAFMRFHTALRFTDVYRKTTRQKVYKFELFADYADDEFALALIAGKKHPDFDFQYNYDRKHESDFFAKAMNGGLVPPAPTKQ